MPLTQEQADKVIIFLRKGREFRNEPSTYPFKGYDPKLFEPYWDKICVFGNGDPIKAAKRDYEIFALNKGWTEEEKNQLFQLMEARKNDRNNCQNRQEIIDRLIDI